MRMMLNVRDSMPSLMHIAVLATGKFVLLQEYRLCAVCV